MLFDLSRRNGKPSPAVMANPLRSLAELERVGRKAAGPNLLKRKDGWVA